MSIRVTLEQWRVFIACGVSVNTENFLCKSQSALSHSLKRLETSNGGPVFTIQGRSLTDSIETFPNNKLKIKSANDYLFPDTIRKSLAVISLQMLIS